MMEIGRRRRRRKKEKWKKKKTETRRRSVPVFFAHPLILEQRKQTRELNVVNPRSNDLFVVSVRIPMN